ncbi:MAG: hypothetical protein HUJ65_00200, partial [Oscillospiraceae bacterium]|nr:hypothetical protein [Oscillospiraceae bacterium]
PVKVYGMIRGKVTTDVYVITTIFILGVLILWLAFMGVKAIWNRKHPK